MVLHAGQLTILCMPPHLSLPGCSPKGSWNNEQAQDNCNPCAPGKYSNTLGSRECKTCAAGTFSAGQASSCTDCRPGYAAPAGAAACSPW
jgi:syndecan 4